MKRILIMSSGLVLAILLSLLCLESVFIDKTEAVQDSLTTFCDAAPASSPEGRESITFIMGEDKDEGNPYYAEALNYYTTNPQARTEYIVRQCHSLREMRDYLEKFPPSNNCPWGLINVVLHSNEWSDMGVSVVPDGKRASVSTIREAMKNDSLKPLADDLIDSNSQMILYGCALGRNTQILKTVSEAFGGEGSDLQRPVVRSSKYFIFYESQKYNGHPITADRYLTDFWYAYYKTGYRPGDIRLSRRLEKRNPDAGIDWRDALTQTRPRFPGDAYHYTFRVPIVWIVTYPEKDSRPVIKTEAGKQTWISEQPELLEMIRKYDLPLEYFNWTFREINYEYEDGSKEPAIKAIGFCTILCVLKALTEPDPEDPGQTRPLIPDVTDRKYYAVGGS